jgi:deoxyadenosine/deoxycytidine kinase
MEIISIEGNICSEKSTFLQYLKEHLASDKICFLDKSVDDWLSIVDTNDKNIIERYYDDQKKYAFSFQMMAYISRLLKRQNKKKIYILYRANYNIYIYKRNR